MENAIVLSFCRSCGILLPPKHFLDVPGHCDNCNGDIESKENRIEGMFPLNDGAALLEMITGIALEVTKPN